MIVFVTDLIQHLDALVYWLRQSGQWTGVVFNMEPDELGSGVLKKQVQVFLTAEQHVNTTCG